MAKKTDDNYKKEFPLVMIVIIFRKEMTDNFRTMCKDLNLPGAHLEKVTGFGRQKGHIELFRGDDYEIEFIEKMKAFIAVPRNDIDKYLEKVRDYLMTGRIGDGKVFIIPVEDAMRIRTGERGEAAI